MSSAMGKDARPLGDGLGGRNRILRSVVERGSIGEASQV